MNAECRIVFSLDILFVFAEAQGGFGAVVEVKLGQTSRQT